MQIVRDWEACQHAVQAVPRVNAAYTSNLYAAREQIERWCAAGQLSLVSAAGAALLLRADRDFYHVYHVATDQQALGAALVALPAGSYTTDLVGQGEPLDQLAATYAGAGFAAHMYFQRMSRSQTPGQLDEQNPAATSAVELASAADGPALTAFLERLLDLYAEQVPDAADMSREAEAGRILLVRRGDAIGGMLMYELKGRTAQLRFWHVDDNARGEGIGRQLMASFLARCAQAQRLVLWVLGHNHSAIAIYHHYGFAPDGLLDRIMIQHRNHQP